MKSHLISQVLLNRFGRNKKIRVEDKYTGRYEYKSADEIAYIDYPLDKIKRLEEKWGYVESRMATAFAELDSGGILHSEKHKDSLRMFMGLHYIRSMTLFAWLQEHSGQYFEQAIRDSIESSPEQTAAINSKVETYKNQWTSALNELYPELVKGNASKIESFMMQYDVEIGCAGNGAEFILADIPIVNIDDGGRMGVLSGVDITNSTTVVLPLGPKHICALTAANVAPKEYRVLTNLEVKNCNKKSRAISYRQYYSRPRSNESIY